MGTTSWFEVDLDTLGLQRLPAGFPADDWAGMSTMLEECLESVVFTNLDLLFEGERLLPIKTQFPLVREPDIVAIDPLGCLRVMEVKKTTTKAQVLRDQDVSYCMAELAKSPTAWSRDLAYSLAYFQDDYPLAVEVFRHGVSRKNNFKHHLPEDTKRGWDRLDRFEKARALREALAAKRGSSASPGVDAVSLTERMFGVRLSEQDVGDEGLEASLDKVLGQWGGRQDRTGVEVTIIAPGVDEEYGGELERRGVQFHLIDAELRRAESEGITTRAVLRWHEVKRTVRARNRRWMIALYQALKDDHPEVAQFWWDCPTIRQKREDTGITLYWPPIRNVFLRIDPSSGTLFTDSDCLTPGERLADLKRAWVKEHVGLSKDLAPAGVGPHTERPRLAVAIDEDKIGPAKALTVAYYESMKQIGAFNLLRGLGRTVEK